MGEQKSKHLCQRAADAQGVSDGFDALRAVRAMAVHIKAAQLVAGQIHLRQQSNRNPSPFCEGSMEDAGPKWAEKRSPVSARR